MIQENIRAIRSEIGKAKLIVVSKNRSFDQMMEVYDSGEREMAENRVQELVKKQAQLPKDVNWHLIGHLQTNKIKHILPIVKLIHSVDSIKLLSAIEKEAEKLNKTIDVLLQVHISSDEAKFGFDPEVLNQLSQESAFSRYSRICFCGVMSMTTLYASDHQKSNEFSETAELMKRIQPFMPNPAIFTELSMGMSDDYAMAVSSGSTMVRIGSALFA